MPQPTIVSSYTDDQFLVAVQAEDPAARKTVYQRFQGLVRSMVARRCPHRAARQPDFVDDVVAQTFLLVLDPIISRFNPRRGRASQYLFGLTCNAIRTITRQRNPICVDLEDPSRSASIRAAHVVYRHTAGSRTVPAADHRLEVGDEVGRIMKQNDPDARQIVRSYFFDGESLPGIAARLRVNRTTVSRKISGFLTTSRLRFA